MKKLIVGLVGQPNVGKSTLFNALTKGNALVVNWPGTTVERKEGRIRYKDYEIVLVDLPGIYSLLSLTLEEKISRNFIIGGQYDTLVVLADSLALERTLYLVVELRELTDRIVLAVTKVDEVHKRGIHINFELLERRLGIPVVPVSAIKNVGLDRLLEVIVSLSKSTGKPFLRVDYGELEPFINAVEQLLQAHLVSKLSLPARWVAVKFLEGDPEITKHLQEVLGERFSELESIKAEVSIRFGADIAALTARARMHFIQEHITKNAIVRVPVKERLERISKIFYNPVVAPVVSISLMLAIFIGVFTVTTGFPLTLILESAGYGELAELVEKFSISNLLESLLEYISNDIKDLLGDNAISSFVVEGVIGGVGAILAFIPPLLITFAILGSLEDSGVLPRLAVGMHSLLQRVGLSGHALLPITLSLGCNVPGVLATRASINYAERLRLIILTPFIPCQARLIVLLAIASGIGGFYGALAVPLAYIVAFAVFIIINYVLYVIQLRKEEYTVEFLLEIPPIHKPYTRVVWWFTWFYLRHFLVKAGTVIFATSIVMWALQHITLGGSYTPEPGNSIIASASKQLAWLLEPIGIKGEHAWIAAFALIVGFIAKELVLSAFLATTGQVSVEKAFEYIGISAPSAISLALLITLYVPCLATLAAIYGESRSIKYIVVTTAVMIAVAYAAALIAYHVASILIT